MILSQKPSLARSYHALSHRQLVCYIQNRDSRRVFSKLPYSRVNPTPNQSEPVKHFLQNLLQKNGRDYHPVLRRHWSILPPVPVSCVARALAIES